MTNESNSRESRPEEVSSASMLARTIASSVAIIGAILGGTVFIWNLTHAEGLPQPALKGELAKGQQAFRQTGCWQCHHPTLKGQRWGGGFGVQRPHTWWVAYLSKPRVMHRRATKQSAMQLLQRTKDSRLALSDDGRALVAYVRYLREMGMTDVTSPRIALKPNNNALKATAYFANIRGLRNETAKTQRPAEGKALYRRYCQNCHGTKGRGDGPLASVLPRPPRDLAQTTKYLCRSSTSALPYDIKRTIRKGTGGCGVIPLDQVLTQSQLDNLVEAVRKIALMQGGRNARAFEWPRRTLPNRGQTMEQAFQKWLNDWWTNEYRKWKASYLRGNDKHLKYRESENWRTWIEWQSFNRWVARNPNAVHANRGDWLVAIQRQGEFMKLSQKWRSKTRTLGFLAWAKQQLRASLIKEMQKKYDTLDSSDMYKMKRALDKAKPKHRKALKKQLRRKYVSSGEKDRQRRLKRLTWWKVWQLWKRIKLMSWYHRGTWVDKQVKAKWRDHLRRKGFTTYESWREREEKSEYRRWRNEQQKLLYMAWKGQVAFRDLGCQQCHTGGTPLHPTIPLPLHKRVYNRNQKVVGAVFAKALPTIKGRVLKPKKAAPQKVAKNKKAKKAAKKVAKKTKKKPPPKIDLTHAKLRCGSESKELFRTIVVGMGPKMPGLTPMLLRKYLGITHFSSLRGRSGAFAPRRVTKIWEAVAYVQFMTRELPILKALPKQKKP